MNQTYKELLSEIATTPCHSNKFIEINKDKICRLEMNDDDYEIFWGCMKIYEAQGINYFPDYIALRVGDFGDFSEGIEQWFLNAPTWECVSSFDLFIKFIETLRFFSIRSYHGIDFSKYDECCKQAYFIYKSIKRKALQQHEALKMSNVQQRIENYFNFKHYSQNRFNEQFKNLIQGEKNALSINEALSLEKEFPLATYIVLLKEKGVVCHIAKTQKPLSYIGTNYKRRNADSAYFDNVDTYYTEDLVLSLKFFLI